MTNENNELRRWFQQLQHNFEQLKTKTEADMKIFAANLEKSLSDNREAFAELKAAFERLRADMIKANIISVVTSVTIMGAIVSILAFLLRGQS